MKGRPPKPAEVHARNGDPGKRHRDAPTNVGGAGVPDMPKGLDRDEKAAWNALVDVAAPVLDVADWPVLEAAAVMVGLARQLRRERIAAQRDLAKARKADADRDVIGAYLDAYLKLYRAERDAHAEARQHVDRLGLGPVARARLGIAGSSKPAAPAPSPDSTAENPRARRAALRAVAGGSK